MKITVHRAGESLVIEGDITCGGMTSDSHRLLRFEVTGDETMPWVELEMDGAEAIRIGGWGMSWIADQMVDEPEP